MAEHEPRPPHGVPHVPRRRRRSARRAVAAAGACCLLAALAACGAGTATGPGPASGTGRPPPAGGSRGPGPAPVPRSGLTKGLVLPLEEYMENYDQRRTISRAEIALEKSCMARYGLTYDPALGGSPPPQYDDANMARRYGVSDPDTAARYGYRLPDDVPPPTQPPMDAAETLVLTGALRPSAGHVPAPARFHGRPVPPGGCVGESVRRIEPAAAGSPDLSLPGRLDAESLDQAEAEPAVRDALKAWSSCMGRRGFVASTPFAATRIAGSDGTSGPGSRGVRVAVADVACKERTGLVKVWYAAEVAVQRRQIEENLPALRAVRDHIGAAVAAAAAVKG